jgi:hypothetical protein
MVPSVPSEQEVGVVVIFVISRFWAFIEIKEDASKRISSMVYLYAFIWA